MRKEEVWKGLWYRILVLVRLFKGNYNRISVKVITTLFLFLWYSSSLKCFIRVQEEKTGKVSTLKLFWKLCLQSPIIKTLPLNLRYKIKSNTNLKQVCSNKSTDLHTLSIFNHNLEPIFRYKTRGSLKNKRWKVRLWRMIKHLCTDYGDNLLLCNSKHMVLYSSN